MQAAHTRVGLVINQLVPDVKDVLGNLPLYAGYWWDAQLEMYHVRHRVYRPEWGKWIQRDPLGYAAGWNLYEYVGGEPWRGIDPSGLDGYWLGAAFRWAGLGAAGDFVDDAVDGARELVSPESPLGAKSKSAMIKSAIGIAAVTAVIITGGAAATVIGPIAAAAWTGGWTVVGTVYLIQGLAEGFTGRESGFGAPLSEEERVVGAAETVGGAIGGLSVSRAAKAIGRVVTWFINTVANTLSGPPAPSTPATPTAPGSAQPGSGNSQGCPTNTPGGNKGNTQIPSDTYSSKAPDQVPPGTRTLKGQYINDQGKIQPWTAYYDQYGRLVARTDYNAGNKAAGIPDIHHHVYRWGPGQTPQEVGTHLPGEYVP